MPLTELPDPARIRIRHRVEWLDTDAAGIYHWSTVARFAEAAEAALHNALGITELTFGATPRLSVSFEFARPLRFNDEVTVRTTPAQPLAQGPLRSQFTPAGLRVDWMTPGGGVQSTLLIH